MLMVFKMVSPNVRVINVGTRARILSILHSMEEGGKIWGGIYISEISKNNRSEEITPAERLTYCF